MAAAATPSFITISDSNIERNSQLFSARPPGIDDRVGRSNTIVRAVETDDNDDARAACMAAMLLNTEEGTGWIEAPIGLMPASYFRNVANHPNILATIVYTARRNAGFLTNAMGQQLSQQEWRNFLQKFNAWLAALDGFWFYITLIDQDVESIGSQLETSDAIVNSLSKFIIRPNANDIEDEAEVVARVNKTFDLATQYMVEKNISEPTHVVQAGFQHESFGIVGASQITLPITFTITTLSKSKSSTIQYSSTVINKFTFRLNSANIIANAETLAMGTTLLSTKAYCDYINAPLHEWEKDSYTPANSKT